MEALFILGTVKSYLPLAKENTQQLKKDHAIQLTDFCLCVEDDCIRVIEHMHLILSSNSSLCCVYGY